MTERARPHPLTCLTGLVLAALACLPGSFAFGADAAPPLEPLEVLRQIRSTQLDTGRAVTLRNLELEVGPARFEISRGVVIPAHTDAGRAVELVFVGQARFRFDPPDEIEAGQLELFTGRPVLDAPVDEAVFVLADEKMLERLLDRPNAYELHRDLIERATEIHHEWLLMPERRNTGVESSIFKMLVGDLAYSGYFAVWSKSYEFGDFVCQLDPEEHEPITLASFTPIDIRGWDLLRLQRHIKIQQRKGRWLGVRLEDLGAWDIWHSSDWKPEGGPAYPGNQGFEARHYEIDATILRDRHRITGVAKLELEALTSGRRAVSLDLYRDMVVRRVVDDRGRELYAFRSGKDVVVHLPEASRAGERLTLEVTYDGRVLKWVGRNGFDLEDTAAWYPHVGTVDRATYDVKLSWPKKYDLVASGKLIDSGRHKHFKWERRQLDRPSTAFSFALGDYTTRVEQVGHVTMSVSFSQPGPRKVTSESHDLVIDALARALRFFEEVFGPYPMDHLTVVSLPRSYAQSYSGFITLADTVLPRSGTYETRASSETIDREILIAHEMAHQWWGNKVGWWSYRDQWLSEAMANYSALLFYSRQQGARSTFLADMSAGWRNALGQRTVDGRTIESIGPIVLGARLNSSLSSTAYRTIVYRKGAVVLAMLARAVGEDRFLEMLRSLIDAATDRVLTTEVFLQAIERMSGLELDGFASRFIYGTGIPEVYYDYEAKAAPDGQWTLRGEATLAREPRYSFAVVRSGDRWDVARTPRTASSAQTTIVVPFRLELESEDGDSRSRSGKIVRSNWGNLMIEGPSQQFEVPTEARPLALQLDPRGEILARFYPIDRYPKRGRRLRGNDLATAGKLAEAEASYREGLAQGMASPKAGDDTSWMRNPADDARIEDARIRLSLARLFTDQHRDDEALAEMEVIDRQLLKDRDLFRMERDVLRSRLEMRDGNFQAAFRRLRRTLRQASPERDAASWGALLSQVRLSSERLAVTEGFALLAICARETGNDEVFSWALAEARDRGVDVSNLR